MNQKGLVPILIVLILAALMGGYLVYQKQVKLIPLPDEKGYLEGKTEFVGKPCPPDVEQQVPPCAGLYPNYEIVIYQSNGKSVVTKTLTDKNGQYKLSLKPGSYIIYTPKGIYSDNLMVNQTIISNNQTTILNLVIDTGIR